MHVNPFNVKTVHARLTLWMLILRSPAAMLLTILDEQVLVKKTATTNTIEPFRSHGNETAQMDKYF